MLALIGKTEFQSRNRESSNFNRSEAWWTFKEALGFNLVIENLLISTGVGGENAVCVFCFNLVIENLLISTYRHRLRKR